MKNYYFSFGERALNIKKYLSTRRAIVEGEIKKLLPSEKAQPKSIHKAMHYALKGGKSIRPILCIASCEAAGGSLKDALKVASALEMIHAYSLVHDDLPSMDNDDYRRGRLTTHKKFGIANAILTGDALLTYAFKVVSEATRDNSLNAILVNELAKAAGTAGMIAGQAADISTKNKSIVNLEYINIHKTGALIASSCKMGALVAKASKKNIRSLLLFGEYTGLIFQVIDDLLDGDGFAKIMGRKETYNYALRLNERAKKSITHLGKKAEALNQISDFILNRKS